MSKSGETVKTLVFATVVSVVAGAALLWAQDGLRARIEQNQKVKKYKYIMMSLGIEVPKGAKAGEVIKLFETKVGAEKLGPVSRYVYRDGDQVKAYAYPISGKGLWGMIYGFLAVKPDLCTVQQISFFKHQETPGLGAEITKKWFTDQFVGKKITKDCSGNPKDIILHVKKKGTADKKTEVDGISGATMTSVAVDKFLVSDMKKILETAHVQPVAVSAAKLAGGEGE